jgi:hypothetical protein
MIKTQSMLAKRKIFSLFAGNPLLRTGSKRFSKKVCRQKKVWGGKGLRKKVKRLIVLFSLQVIVCPWLGLCRNVPDRIGTARWASQE